MPRTTVTTQTELDAALTNARNNPDAHHQIDIRSERGVLLVIDDTPDRSTVRALDQSTVEAWGQSTVEAWGQSTVEAGDQSTAEAWGQSTVRAWGQSTVRARGQSIVRAGDRSTVRAGGQSTVRAGGQSTVEAWDQSTVEAWDRSTVEAWGQSTVRAGDRSTVRAWGQSTVEAGTHCAVHLHSGRATVTGGVLVDHTSVDLSDAATWAGYHGCRIEGDYLIAYKAVRDDYRSARGTDYRPGVTATCDDWADTDACGGGLHFSPSPAQARDYDREATRFVELRVSVAGVRPITGGGTPKAKARVVECVREVDTHGRPVTT